ncbi:hypothetical protein ACFFX1_26905 [Dactylosporangium sucinum]|uniref:hypothetical protein n=1 Tax=Dactylosporangium sucinum TaxID=1424081 RepID=UPI00167C9D1B|nr:hypothetical protein [Dactylosporangium sucinum]
MATVKSAVRSTSRTPAIGATNFAGGYPAAEHLVGPGHRRIAAIGGHEQFQMGTPGRYSNDELAR